VLDQVRATRDHRAWFSLPAPLTAATLALLLGIAHTHDLLDLLLIQLAVAHQGQEVGDLFVFKASLLPLRVGLLHNTDEDAEVRVAVLGRVEVGYGMGEELGIAANQRWFFIGFTIIVLVGGLYVFGTRFFPRETTAHCALGLVMAGALGNFYDRVVFGVVRDFIQFMPGRRLPNGWMWPGGNPELMPWVFNIADVLLLVGLVTLMTFVGRRRRRRRRRKAGI